MSRRTGFTLLEMLLVVLILATLAATTSSMVSDAHEQARYEDTSARMRIIRNAIAGPDDATAPIAGFVADVGRLPTNLAELIAGTDSYVVDPTWRVGSGWRGPYLRGGIGTGATLEFPDGWGTPNDPARPDDFGWILTPDSPAGGDLTITSLGSDAKPGPPTSATFDYATDASTTIWRRDHHVNLTTDWPTVEVIVRPDTLTSANLALRVWIPDGSGGLTSLDGAVTTRSLQAGLENTVDLPLPAAWIPHGVRAVELCRSTGPSQSPTSVPVSSNPTDPQQQFVLLTFRPRTAYPTRLGRTFRLP